MKKLINPKGEFKKAKQSITSSLKKSAKKLQRNVKKKVKKAVKDAKKKRAKKIKAKQRAAQKARDQRLREIQREERAQKREAERQEKMQLIEKEKQEQAAAREKLKEEERQAKEAEKLRKAEDEANMTPEEKEIKKLKAYIETKTKDIMKLENELEQLYPDAEREQEEFNKDFNDETGYTLQWVRKHVLGKIDSDDPILDLIRDDSIYYHGDFRLHLIKAGMNNRARDISKKIVGLEPFNDFMNRNAAPLKTLVEYGKTKAKSERAWKGLNAAKDKLSKLEEIVI